MPPLPDYKVKAEELKRRTESVLRKIQKKYSIDDKSLIPCDQDRLSRHIEAEFNKNIWKHRCADCISYCSQPLSSDQTAALETHAHEVAMRYITTFHLLQEFVGINGLEREEARSLIWAYQGSASIEALSLYQSMGFNARTGLAFLGGIYIAARDAFSMAGGNSEFAQLRPLYPKGGDPDDRAIRQTEAILKVPGAERSNLSRIKDIKSPKQQR